MVTFRESGSHHSKGIIVAIGRLLSRDVTSVKSPGASNYSHSPDHDKDTHGEGGRSECKVESGHAPDNLFRDVILKCRDGSVGWSKFLLAANSPLLSKSLSQTEQDEGCDVILLPDMSVSTVTSMLGCTLNPAVRNDTLSVNEEEVMALLGFTILTASSPNLSTSGVLPSTPSTLTSSAVTPQSSMHFVTTSSLTNRHQRESMNESTLQQPPSTMLDQQQSLRRNLSVAPPVDETRMNNSSSAFFDAGAAPKRPPNSERELNTPTLSMDQEMSDNDNESEPETLGAISPTRSLLPDHLSCPECGLRFQRQLHLERHLASHDERNRLACQQCGKIFYHKDNLKLHQRYHLDKAETRACDECGENFQGSRALKSHKEKMHSPDITCPSCDKKFKSKSLLKRHQARIHPFKDTIERVDEGQEASGSEKEESTTVYCHICGKGFQSAQAMAVHKRSHQLPSSGSGGRASSSTSKYVHCPDCNKLFASPSHLKLHQKRSHETEHVQCDKCDKSVKNLRKHQMTCHPQESSLPSATKSPTSEPLESKALVPCPECDATFSSKYVMKSHFKRTHQVQKDFKCRRCDRTFVDNTGLRRHCRETHGENSHECSECGLFFPVRHSLERHLRNVHNPVKQECPKCGISVVHLSAHLTTVHKMSPGESRGTVEELTGKSAARTDLPYQPTKRQKQADD